VENNADSGNAGSGNGAGENGAMNDKREDEETR
jgi:hypothetical protein